MKNNKILSVLTILLNTFGILCLIYFSVPYLIHDTRVTNPEAMLPMEKWDGAGIILTAGLLPMAVANTAGYFFLFEKRENLIRKFLIFLPCTIELIIVIHYWISALR